MEEIELVMTEAWDLAVLNEIRAAESEHAGFLVGCKAALHNVEINPTRTTALGTLTKPTYTGYADVVVTQTAPSISDAGKVELVSSLAGFRPTDALGSSTTAWGVMLLNGAADTLYGACKFPNGAKALGKTTDELKLVLKVRADNRVFASIIN